MDALKPQKEHKFSFGLWTVGNRGRDPFGEATRGSRSRPQPSSSVCAPELGAHGVNLHDNDLVPIDATPGERHIDRREFKAALGRLRHGRAHGDDQSLLRPGLQGRRFHLVRPARPPLRAAEGGPLDGPRRRAGGEDLRFLGRARGGRGGTPPKDARDAIKWFREAINFLCEYSISQGYGYKFAMEAKPNEPRGDIYFPSTGAYLGFIATLNMPEMVGVNPEVGHGHMSGLNFYHVVAQALEAGKLFHIDLNDQKGPPLRPGFAVPAPSPSKALFFLVKLLEEGGYEGPRHFDAHSLPQRGRGGRLGFRRRVHAELPDLQGEGTAVRRRSGDPRGNVCRDPLYRPGFRAGAGDLYARARRADQVAGEHRPPRADAQKGYPTSGSIN